MLYLMVTRAIGSSFIVSVGFPNGADDDEANGDYTDDDDDVENDLCDYDDDDHDDDDSHGCSPVYKALLSATISIMVTSSSPECSLRWLSKVVKIQHCNWIEKIQQHTTLRRRQPSNSPHRAKNQRNQTLSCFHVKIGSRRRWPQFIFWSWVLKK